MCNVNFISTVLNDAFTPCYKLKRIHGVGFVSLALWNRHTYLKQSESDQIAAWTSRGAGLFHG